MFLLLFVVHNCRNEEINLTKSDFFYKHFLICNPKLCINHAIKVTFNFYRNYKLMSTVQTPVCVVSVNGLGVFMA